jgi:hypothetical protein
MIDVLDRLDNGAAVPTSMSPTFLGTNKIDPDHFYWVMGM